MRLQDPKFISEDLRNEIRKAYELDGLNVAAIAKRMNVRSAVIRRLAIEYKWCKPWRVKLPEDKTLWKDIFTDELKEHTVLYVMAKYGVGGRTVTSQCDSKAIRRSALEVAIKKCFEDGMTIEAAVKKLCISRDTLLNIAGDLDWVSNCSRFMSRIKSKNINKDKIVRQYLTGKFTGAELAEKYGVAQSTIDYILREKNSKWTRVTARRTMPLETFLKILEMITQGQRLIDIARDTGYTRAYICNIKAGRWVHPDYFKGVTHER